MAKKGDILKPFGEVDVLLLYGLVAKELRGFLKGREIAARTWLPNRNILKRGSYMEPLYVDELAKNVTPDLLRARSQRKELVEKTKGLTPVQEKIWRYFLPAKLSDLFYATNGEGKGKKIDRIFLDIDRPDDIKHEVAREVAAQSVKLIRADDIVGDLVAGEPFVAWTGSSFHVYLFLKDKQPKTFYDEYFQYTGDRPSPQTLTEKWVEKLKGMISGKVIGGHEKRPGVMTIDPSQTPSGKLARAPLGCLHIADRKSVDGTSVPLTLDVLDQKGITDELRRLTPGDVIEDLKELGKRLPRSGRGSTHR